MISGDWYKSSRILVLRDGPNLRLTNLTQQTTCRLTGWQVHAWSAWAWDQYEGLGSPEVLARLEQGQFVAPRLAPVPPLARLQGDWAVPSIRTDHTKWYAESPDLHILFNSARMQENNPLIALGPYGSLCWSGVTLGRTIYEIRAEAVRIFGRDDVIPGLQRLCRLGFLHVIPALQADTEGGEHSTTEFHAPHLQSSLRQSVVPWYCLWEVNRTCDLRCATCYLPDFDDPGLDTVLLRQIARRIIEAGIFHVTLMGGEPLLRDDLESVVAFLRSARIFVKVISNGQSLSPERAARLVDSGLNQIEVSFDGLSARTHDQFRGAGTYERACESVRIARELGIARIGIVWTLHSANCHELPLLPEFLNALGIQDCYISLFRRAGLRGSTAWFDPIDALTLSSLSSTLAAIAAGYPNLQITLLSECTCGRTSVVVGSDGQLRICPFQPGGAGSLLEHRLLDLWAYLDPKAPAARRLRFCSQVDQDTFPTL